MASKKLMMLFQISRDASSNHLELFKSWSLTVITAFNSMVTIFSLILMEKLGFFRSTAVHQCQPIHLKMPH